LREPTARGIFGTDGCAHGAASHKTILHARPMSAYDPGPIATAGAPPILRHEAEVNGIVLPDALLVPEAWLPGLFVRVNPVEVSWFADVPVARVVAALTAVSGKEPRRRHVVDRYFDTPGRALFHRRVSVRLRHYVDPPRSIAYEIIAVGWGGEEAGGRRVHGFVQTFGANDAADIPRIVARYRAAGFEEVARIEKTRHAFEVVPAVSVDATGRRLVSPELMGVAGAQRYLRVVDFGIKLDVDDVRDSPFPEPSIVEVEYDPARRAQAAPYVERIVRAFTGRLRAKESNKIALLLGEAD
jgi:adenylate cyclase class IV